MYANTNQGFHDESGNPVIRGPPIYPPPVVNYQQGPYPGGMPPPGGYGPYYGHPAYGQPVAPNQPNTVIIKEKKIKNDGVAEGCCAGFCAACLACLCCCCMAAAAADGPRHHHHRRW